MNWYIPVIRKPKMKAIQTSQSFVGANLISHLLYLKYMTAKPIIGSMMACMVPEINQQQAFENT